MRIGVTGASGYVARTLTATLRARGHTIVGLDHRPPRAPGHVDRFVQGDVRDTRALRDLASDVDAVAHLAAHVHRAADTPEARARCISINEGGTRALIAALDATARRPHLVMISSIAVYGATFANRSESGATAPVGAYAESKLAGEHASLEASARGAITACVVRPAAVYGAGAPGNTGRLRRLIARGVVPMVRGARNRKSCAHVEDLALAIARAAEQPRAVDGRIWNAASEPITVRDMVEAIARGSGRTARWLPVPAFMFDAAARLGTGLSRASGGRVPDLGRALEVFSGEAWVEASAIVRGLGVTFRPTIAGIEAAAREQLARETL